MEQCLLGLVALIVDGWGSRRDRVFHQRFTDILPENRVRAISYLLRVGHLHRPRAEFESVAGRMGAVLVPGGDPRDPDLPWASSSGAPAASAPGFEGGSGGESGVLPVRPYDQAEIAPIASVVLPWPLFGSDRNPQVDEILRLSSSLARTLRYALLNARKHLRARFGRTPPPTVNRSPAAGGGNARPRRRRSFRTRWPAACRYRSPRRRSPR